MFRTKYEKVEEVKYTEAGSPIKTIYEGVYDKLKNLNVVPKGEENLYAFINSFSEQADINVIMKRYQQGDKEILLQRAGSYLDISNIPSSFQEIVDVGLAANNVWNTLPVEIKEKFNNNVNLFISQMDSDEWKEIMNTSEEQIIKDQNKETKEYTKKTKEMIKPVKPIENPGVDADSDGKEDIS